MNNLSNTEQLQTHFREQRDIQNFPDNFRLRIHRTLSWLRSMPLTKNSPHF